VFSVKSAHNILGYTFVFLGFSTISYFHFRFR